MKQIKDMYELEVDKIYFIKRKEPHATKRNQAVSYVKALEIMHNRVDMREFETGEKAYIQQKSFDNFDFYEISKEKDPEYFL